jgi:hypothetical protein
MEDRTVTVAPPGNPMKLAVTLPLASRVSVGASVKPAYQ